VSIKPFYRILLAAALLGGGLFGLGGCERPPTSGFVAEVDEPNFRRGRELRRQGRDPACGKRRQKPIFAKHSAF
jgi:hypothetical protein